MEVLDDFQRLLVRCPAAGNIPEVRFLLETEVMPCMQLCDGLRPWRTASMPMRCVQRKMTWTIGKINYLYNFAAFSNHCQDYSGGCPGVPAGVAAEAAYHHHTTTIHSCSHQHACAQRVETETRGIFADLTCPCGSS